MIKSLFLVFICLITSLCLLAQNEDEPIESASSSGLFNLLIGDYAEAEKNFTLAIEAHEDEAKSYYFRGKARCGIEKFDLALKDFTVSIQMDPTYSSTYEARGQVYSRIMKEYAKALADFNKILELDPTFENIHQSIGSVYFEMEEFERALIEFNKAVEIDPNNGKAYRKRGGTHIILGRNEEGCADLAKARKLGEKNLDQLIELYCSEIGIDPEYEMDETDWTRYEATVQITAENAHTITSFSDDNPESMVTYFYASKIRGDEKGRDVLPDESQWSDRMNYSLNKYSHWNFKVFDLVEKKRYAIDKWWIKVYFEIEVNGEQDGGTDEVTLSFDGSKWTITEVPN